MEYRRLINRMRLLEKQKRAKNTKLIIVNDGSKRTQDISVTIINDQQQASVVDKVISKPVSLVKKVLVKNVSIKARENINSELSIVSNVLYENKNVLPTILKNKKDMPVYINDNANSNINETVTGTNNEVCHPLLTETNVITDTESCIEISPSKLKNSINDISNMCENERNQLLQEAENEYSKHR